MDDNGRVVGRVWMPVPRRATARGMRQRGRTKGRYEICKNQGRVLVRSEKHDAALRLRQQHLSEPFYSRIKPIDDLRLDNATRALKVRPLLGAVLCLHATLELRRSTSNCFISDYKQVFLLLTTMYQLRTPKNTLLALI